MKKLTIVVLTCVTGLTMAQKINLDKYGIKKGGETTESTERIKAEPGASQYARLELFLTSASKMTSYKHYKYEAIEKYKKDVGPIATTEMFTDIKRDENNQIISFNFSGDTYKPDNPGFPKYYYGSYDYMYFNADHAFKMKSKILNETDLDNSTNGNGTYLITGNSTIVSGLVYESYKTLFKELITDTKEGSSTYSANVLAAEKKAEEEKRAKYSIKGKEVVSIKIVKSGDKAQQGKTYSFEIVAKLKDGSEISTGNSGFRDDYDITVSGMADSYEGGYGKTNVISNFSTSIEFPMAMAPSKDKVTITAKSKYHPNVAAASTSWVMEYGQTVTANYSAEKNSMSFNQRTIADHLRVELKQVKHTETGEDLLEYKIFAQKNGNLLMHFKTKPNTPVNVSSNGQNGWGATEKKAAQDGLNGGDIKIIVDPSVTSYNVNTSSIGGQGGQGGNGYPSGRTGDNGKIETIKQKVNW